MVKDIKLLILAPHYHTFIKGLSDAISKFISDVHFLIHHNYLAEFARFIPFSYFRHVERFSKRNLVDLKNKPKNIKIKILSNIYFIPDSKNKKLGEKLFKKFYKYISKQNILFDLIHVHFIWPLGYVGIKLAYKYNVPVVLHTHGFDIYDLPFRNAFWFNKVKSILNASTAVFTVNMKFKNLIVEKFGVNENNVFLIPNGFDSKLFFPMNKIEARKKLNLPLNKKIILNVASLTPIKGHKYLIEAINKIKKIRDDVICIIIGDGPLRKYLLKLIIKKKLKETVWLIGSRPHYEIPLWMNSADLFVLPSLKEGNPTVMFEALGTGLPFIGTNVGGIPEIILSEDYGFLCDVANVEDLTEKILHGLNKRWNKEKILNYAKQFSWENISKKVIKIYEELL